MSNTIETRLSRERARHVRRHGLGLLISTSLLVNKSWILRVTVKGQSRRREIGLGHRVAAVADAQSSRPESCERGQGGRDPSPSAIFDR